MRLSELIIILQEHARDCEHDPEVHFAYNYGDHWKTEVAPAVEEVGMGQVKHSSYHRMDVTVDEESKDYREDDAGVVILRG